MYIAHNGRVYDVFRSFHWRTGCHHHRHCAGQNLTAVIPAAPHSADIMSRLPVVETLVD